MVLKTTYQPPPEIRVFLTSAEVQAEPGFKPENAITKENYQSLIGDYAFQDEEIKCCFQGMSGKLCHEDHKRGFVVRLKDQTITVVGNQCARNRFGIDSTIRSDSSRYEAEKRRRAKRARTADLLGRKHQALESLAAAEGKVAALQGRIDSIKRQLGDAIARRLAEFGRTGRSAVVVNAVSLHEYVDEDGEKRSERTVVRSEIGRIGGTQLFVGATSATILRDIASSSRAYRMSDEEWDPLESTCRHASLSIL